MDARALALALPRVRAASTLSTTGHPRRTGSSSASFPARALLREKLCARAASYARGSTVGARALGDIDSRGLTARVEAALGVGCTNLLGAEENSPALLLLPATAIRSPRPCPGQRLLGRCTPSERAHGVTHKETEKTQAEPSGGVKEAPKSKKLLLDLAVVSLIVAARIAPNLVDALGVRAVLVQRLKLSQGMIDASARVLVLAKWIYTLLKETKDVSEVFLYFLDPNKTNK